MLIQFWIKHTIQEFQTEIVQHIQLKKGLQKPDQICCTIAF